MLSELWVAVNQIKQILFLYFPIFENKGWLKREIFIVTSISFLLFYLVILLFYLFLVVLFHAWQYTFHISFIIYVVFTSVVWEEKISVYVMIWRVEIYKIFSLN